MATTNSQPKIFLSYSHRDKQWADRLRIHLRAIAKDIEVWEDTQIDAGANWEDEITKAIDSADVAILLISADFLASEFVSNFELPPLIESGKHGDTLILPIMVSPAHLGSGNPLLNFQFANSPEFEPLNMIY